jgi:hypothetical protein
MSRTTALLFAIAVTGATVSLTATTFPAEAASTPCSTVRTLGQYPSYKACMKAYAKVRAKARAKERMKARQRRQKILDASRKSRGRLDGLKIRKRITIRHRSRRTFTRFRSPRRFSGSRFRAPRFRAPRYHAPRFRAPMPRFRRMLRPSLITRGNSQAQSRRREAQPRSLDLPRRRPL